MTNGSTLYLASRLLAKERESLAEKEKKLLQEKTELDARLTDRLETLAAERKKKLTEQPAVTLEEAIRAGNDEL